jgi:hypothetical protein
LATQQLKVRISVAINVGLSSQDVVGRIIQMTVYDGLPSPFNGMLLQHLLNRFRFALAPIFDTYGFEEC